MQRKRDAYADAVIDFNPEASLVRNRFGRALYSSASKRLDAIRRPVRLAALLQGERMFGLVTLALGST